MGGRRQIPRAVFEVAGLQAGSSFRCWCFRVGRSPGASGEAEELDFFLRSPAVGVHLVLIAKRYVILRAVKAGDQSGVPLSEEPIRVVTLINEKLFHELDGAMIHMRTVFFEDRIHDWNWHNNTFRYFTRVVDVGDVLIVYEEEEDSSVRFDPMTGARIARREDVVEVKSSGAGHF